MSQNDNNVHPVVETEVETPRATQELRSAQVCWDERKRGMCWMWVHAKEKGTCVDGRGRESVLYCLQSCTRRFMDRGAHRLRLCRWMRDGGRRGLRERKKLMLERSARCVETRSEQRFMSWEFMMNDEESYLWNISALFCTVRASEAMIWTLRVRTWWDKTDWIEIDHRTCQLRDCVLGEQQRRRAMSWWEIWGTKEMRSVLENVGILDSWITKVVAYVDLRTVWCSWCVVGSFGGNVAEPIADDLCETYPNVYLHIWRKVAVLKGRAILWRELSHSHGGAGVADETRLQNVLSIVCAADCDVVECKLSKAAHQIHLCGNLPVWHKCENFKATMEQVSK